MTIININIIIMIFMETENNREQNHTNFQVGTLENFIFLLSIYMFMRNVYVICSSDRPTNQPTPWSRIILGKPIITRLVNKFPAFQGTRRFITVFTSSRHWSLS